MANKINILLIGLLFSFASFAQNDSCDLLELAKNNDFLSVKAMEDVNVNIRNSRNYTPLMYAVENRNIEMAEYFISKGAIINYPKNGCTASMIAAENRDLDMLRILSLHGADFNAVDSTQMGWGGAKTILDYSFYDGCYCKEVIDFLLENGARVEGTNVLSYAVWIRNVKHSEKLEIIQDLIDRGADVMVSGDSGYPLLDIAKIQGDEHLYNILSEAGAWDEIIDDWTSEPEILPDEGCECP